MLIDGVPQAQFGCDAIAEVAEDREVVAALRSGGQSQEFDRLDVLKQLAIAGHDYQEEYDDYALPADLDASNSWYPWQEYLFNTEVGMNVLAPVCQDGRLRPEINAKGIQGFRAGQSLVGSPESRRKAMHERVGGETCPRLTIEDLLEKGVLDQVGRSAGIAPMSIDGVFEGQACGVAPFREALEPEEHLDGIGSRELVVFLEREPAAHPE